MSRTDRQRSGSAAETLAPVPDEEFEARALKAWIARRSNAAAEEEARVLLQRLKTTGTAGGVLGMLRALAERGSLVAGFGLPPRRNGRDGSVDEREKALVQARLVEAARAGCPPACRALAAVWLKRREAAWTRAAAALLQTGAELGSPGCLADLAALAPGRIPGITVFEEREHTAALLARLADFGAMGSWPALQAAADLCLRLCCQHGELAAERARVLDLLRAMAAGGHAPAALAAGRALVKGTLSRPDVREAVGWFSAIRQKAGPEANDACACLAELMTRCRDVMPDLGASQEELLHKAALRGSILARSLHGSLIMERCLLSDRGSSADAARYLRTSAQAGAPGEACGTGLMLVMRHLERDGKGYPALLPENPRFLQTARAGAKGKTPPQKERDDRPAMSFRSGLELLQAASASGSREAGVHLAMLRLIGADGMGGADGRQDGLAMLEAECARDNPPAFGALAGVLLQGLHGVARQPERGLALALQGFARRDPRSSALICLLRLGHLRPFPAAPGAAQNALPDSIRQLPVTSVEASGLLLWLACRRERLAQLAAQLWSSRSGAPSAEGRDLLDGRGLSAPMVRVLTRALNEADTGPAALLETFLADNAGSAGQPDGSQERNRDRSRDRSGNGARARANAAAETRDLSPAAIAALCALYRTDCRAALRRKTYDAPRFLDFAAAHAQGSI